MAATMIQPAARPRVGMLIASPDPQFRRRWLQESTEAGAPHREVEGGAHALAKLSECECERVILDLRMLDLDAAEVAELIRRQYPGISVEMVDSRASAAASQVAEGLDEPFVEPKQTQAEQQLQEKQVSSEEEEVCEPLPGMIGESRAMQKMYQLVRLVASRETAVLLMGETGTGKELVAHAIHQLSSRAKNAFVAVNCAAIPEALLEAELFGHVRGAFTGAVQSRLGRIHVAQGGTLFLDEVGELPLSMQAKLLRFLQNGEVQRLGSSDVYRVDVRVVCATNVGLLEQVQAKRFRQDLYYRLAIFPIAVPPLRERAEDINALSRHFLEKLSSEVNIPEKHLSSRALGYLEKQGWPGNVRELQHAVERAFILSGNQGELSVEHFRQLGRNGELREI